VAGGGSYLSQSDLRVHFGLGEASKADAVEIAWPSGAKQVIHDLVVDHFYTIEEEKSPH
jgi:hypothetical protein